MLRRARLKIPPEARVRGSYECIRMCKLIEDAYAFLAFVLVNRVIFLWNGKSL